MCMSAILGHGTQRGDQSSGGTEPGGATRRVVDRESRASQSIDHQRTHLAVEDAEGGGAAAGSSMGCLHRGMPRCYVRTAYVVVGGASGALSGPCVMTRPGIASLR